MIKSILNPVQVEIEMQRNISIITFRYRPLTAANLRTVLLLLICPYPSSQAFPVCHITILRILANMSRLIVHLLSTIDRNISRSDTCVCWIATHLSVIHPSNESGPSVNKPASQQVKTTAATSPSLIINYISFNCRMCAAMQCGVESVNHHTYGMFLPGYYHHHLLLLLRLYLIFLSPSIRDF